MEVLDKHIDEKRQRLAMLQEQVKKEREAKEVLAIQYDRALNAGICGFTKETAVLSKTGVLSNPLSIFCP